MDVQRRYWLLAYEGGALSVAFGLLAGRTSGGFKGFKRAARGRELE